MGEGCPLPSRLRGSGVGGEASAEDAFWRILKAIERSFLHLYAEIFAAATPLFGGGGNAESRLDNMYSFDAL